MRRGRATTSYYWLEGAWSLLTALAFTLTLVYQVEVAHLSPLQLVLVGTALEATCFLGEIPTGVVADLYSRRLSVLIGLVLIGAGIVLQGALPSFWPILLAQVVWGIGYTFVSGALQAWITDEVGAEAVQPVFTRVEQQHLALTIVGTVAAGVLGSVNLQLPMLVAGAGYLVLFLVMALVMPETAFQRAAPGERETYAHMKRLLADGLAAARRPGVVRSFLIIALLAGLSSEVFDRLWTARILDAFSLPTVFGIEDPAIWFTAFALVGSLIALVASLTVNKVRPATVNSLHPAALLGGLVGIQVVGILAFAISGNLWVALAAMWLRNAARAIADPIQSAWLNRNVESRARATTLSLTSQADALGQVVGGPPLGALATRTSIPIALLVSAVIYAPAAVVYARLRPAANPAPTGDHDS